MPDPMCPNRSPVSGLLRLLILLSLAYSVDSGYAVTESKQYGVAGVTPAGLVYTIEEHRVAMVETPDEEEPLAPAVTCTFRLEELRPDNFLSADGAPLRARGQLGTAGRCSHWSLLLWLRLFCMPLVRTCDGDAERIPTEQDDGKVGHLRSTRIRELQFGSLERCAKGTGE